MEAQLNPLPPSTVGLNKKTKISEYPELDTIKDLRMALHELGIHHSQNDKMSKNAEPNGYAPHPLQNSPMISQRALERVVSQNGEGVNHADPLSVTEPGRRSERSHGMVTLDQMMQKIGGGYHNLNNLNQNQENKDPIYVPLPPSPTMLRRPTATAPNSHNGIAEIFKKAEIPAPAASRRMTEHYHAQQTPQDHMTQKNYGYQDSFYFFPPQAYNYPTHDQLYSSPPIYEHAAVFAPNSYNDIAYWNGQFNLGMSTRVTQYALKTPSEVSMEMFASISHRDFDFMHDFSYFTSWDVSPYGIPCISFDEISDLEREHRKTYSKYFISLCFGDSFRYQMQSWLADTKQ
ncbi:unnamed protein product [Caenorhabditis nigoni]